MAADLPGPHGDEPVWGDLSKYLKKETQPKIVHQEEGVEPKMKTEESGKRPRYVWFIIMGSLLSSATWSSIVYGPTAVKALGDFVEWCNRPPELSEMGQKINDMIDDESGWCFDKRESLAYNKDGNRKLCVYTKTGEGGSKTEFLTAYGKNVSERLGKSEHAYLVTRIKSLTDSLKIKIKNAENAAILRDLE